jgi:hypothetical protein
VTNPAEEQTSGERDCAFCQCRGRHNQIKTCILGNAESHQARMEMGRVIGHARQCGESSAARENAGIIGLSDIERYLTGGKRNHDVRQMRRTERRPETRKREQICNEVVHERNIDITFDIDISGLFRCKRLY